MKCMQKKFLINSPNNINHHQNNEHIKQKDKIA